MAMLQFDAATARLLENAYRGSDVVKRRVHVANQSRAAATPTFMSRAKGTSTPAIVKRSVPIAKAPGSATEAIGGTATLACARMVTFFH
jgi:hypothetical protein